MIVIRPSLELLNRIEAVVHGMDGDRPLEPCKVQEPLQAEYAPAVRAKHLLQSALECSPGTSPHILDRSSGIHVPIRSMP